MQKIHHPFPRRQSKKSKKIPTYFLLLFCVNAKVNTCSEPLQLSVCKQTADTASVLIVPCLLFSFYDNEFLLLDSSEKPKSYKLVKCQTFIIVYRTTLLIIAFQ